MTFWLDSGYVVDLVLFDFSKAFDVVNHAVPLDQLRQLRVGGSVLPWIESFLVGRRMRACMSGVVSGQIQVLSGVPQSSVLGHVLFLIFINHVVSHLSYNFKIFADDLKLYLIVRHGSLVDLLTDITGCQRDIDILNSTAESWVLSMKVDKCVAMRFHRGSVGWKLAGPYTSYYLNGTQIKIG